MGTSEFLAISDRVLRSGSSQHDPDRAASAHIPVRGTSAAAAPNLLLGSGNGGGMASTRRRAKRCVLTGTWMPWSRWSP